MINNELEKKLEEIWEAKIISTNIDILKNKIKFAVSAYIYLENKTKDYNLTFCNASNFYFVEGVASGRFNIPEFSSDGYYEICSIGYHENGIGLLRFFSYPWAEKYYSHCNFAIEFLSGALFIEAEAIQINDQYFHVGFPKI